MSQPLPTGRPDGNATRSANRILIGWRGSRDVHPNIRSPESFTYGPSLRGFSATREVLVSAQVKICGLSTPEAMAAALEAGADYVGLVFFPPSPRHVEIGVARELAMMASGTADVVALVVDPDDALVGRIAAELGPDMIQLHGHETPERVMAVGEMAATRTMKAVAVADRADAQRALDYRAAADMILFDAKPPKEAVLPGGNGLAFDWAAIAEVAGQVDYMLSGGLTPGNVAEAIRVTGTRAVDVSSGVESAPGVKDPALISAFIAAAKAVR